MSSTRIMIAAAVFAVLGLLVLFNHHRWQMVASCHERGGVWDGADSRCRLIPRIIIQRDLQRS